MMDDDPYVMYIVIRKSLELSAGKVGAQCGHAVQYLMQALRHRNHSATEEWLQTTDHTKIVLGASDEEFIQVQGENPEHFKVIDLGRTEVEPNTVTAVALWPMRKSERSPMLKQLKPLGWRPK